MRFQHPSWIPISWSLAAINVAAVWFAAQPGEPMHPTSHALLAAGFAIGAERLMARRRMALLEEDHHALLDQNDEAEQLMDGMESRFQEMEQQLEQAERLLAQHRHTDPHV